MADLGMDRFAVNPVNISIPRSVFDRNFTHKFDAPTAALVPFYCEEVMPGDSVALKTNALVRLHSQALPPMDQILCDLSYWFVPMRLVWSHTKQFFGENDSPAWTESNTYTIPCLGDTQAANMVEMNALSKRTHNAMQYLGVNVGIDDDDWSSTANTYNTGLKATLADVSILPIRAYKLIHHVWFRDENYSAATGPTLGDTCDAADVTVMYDIDGNTLQPIWKDGAFERVWALHDAFTSVLPGPQFGDAVRIPVGKGQIPVSSMSGTSTVANDAWTAPMTWASYANSKTGSRSGTGNLAMDSSGRSIKVTGSPTSAGFVIPDNLFANMDVATSALGATINEIRFCYALQKYEEKSARAGRRYHESIQAHFGCTNPDSRVQIPEYLGGKRFMLNQDTVVATAESGNLSLGDYGGYSKTFDSVDGFAKSFTEYGYLIGVVCFRPRKTWFQGTGPMWFRKKKLDFYTPEFAYLGEDAVKNKYVMLTGSHDEDPFGYQEFGYEYRYSPSRLSGSFRPNASDNSLSGFTYASPLAYRPTGEYTVAARLVNPTAVSNTLNYTANKYPFICDFHVSQKWTRPMPVYSIPGLTDHY